MNCSWKWIVGDKLLRNLKTGIVYIVSELLLHKNYVWLWIVNEYFIIKNTVVLFLNNPSKPQTNFSFVSAICQKHTKCGDCISASPDCYWCTARVSHHFFAQSYLYLAWGSSNAINWHTPYIDIAQLVKTQAFCQLIKVQSQILASIV